MKNVEDIYPLSPLQQGLLFHALKDPESPAYLNQCSFTLRNLDAALFRQTWERVLARHAILRTAFLWERLKEPLQAVRSLLHGTVAHLLAHHDSLRLRFEMRDGQWWQQSFAAPAQAPFTWIDLSALPAALRQRAQQHAATALQSSLSFTAGPLLRAALFERGAGLSDLVLIVIHNLVIDGVSWRVLLEDFAAVYQQAARGQVPELGPKTTSYLRWAELLAGHARSAALAAQAAWWLDKLRKPVPPLPLDVRTGGNLSGSARHVTALLEAEETRALLQDVPREHGTQIQEVLLTAVAEALARWTGSRRQRILLEGHGREDVLAGVDVSRTVGWLTSLFPVVLDLEGFSDPEAALRSIKDQLREVPERGFGYGLLRYLQGGRDEESLRALPEPEVLFNYLGQLDAVVSTERGFFRPSREPAGEVSHPLQARPHLLEINGSVAGGRLRTVWTYSENRHRRATIEALAETFVTVLRGLISRSPSHLVTASYTSTYSFPCTSHE